MNGPITWRDIVMIAILVLVVLIMLGVGVTNAGKTW